MRLPRIPKLVTGAPADLSERDPDFIRQMLPRLWLVAQTWFRAEVRGFENVPDEPVLFVGNHSGGAMVPDTFVFLLAHNTYFTVEGRPLYALGHEMVTAMPFFGPLARKIGVVTADPQAAAADLRRGRFRAGLPRRRRRGAAPVARPAQDRLRRPQGLPQARPRQRRQDRARRRDRRPGHLLRPQRRPEDREGAADGQAACGSSRCRSASASRGCSASPATCSTCRCPAKIRIQVMEPVDLQERFGDDPDWDEAYDYVTSLMQAGLSTLASKTILPIVG